MTAQSTTQQSPSGYMWRAREIDGPWGSWCYTTKAERPEGFDDPKLIVEVQAVFVREVPQNGALGVEA